METSKIDLDNVADPLSLLGRANMEDGWNDEDLRTERELQSVSESKKAPLSHIYAEHQIKRRGRDSNPR